MGIDDWRVRECADAATAVTLARDHHHVAFVAKSAVRGCDTQLRVISIPGLANWTIRSTCYIYRETANTSSSARSLTRSAQQEAGPDESIPKDHRPAHDEGEPFGDPLSALCGQPVGSG